MNLRDPKLWLGLFSAAGVAWLAKHDLENARSPGELARVHGRIPELQGGSGCAQCHGEGKQSMTDACLACHQPIADHIERGAGLHGALAEEVGVACALCHSDHHGAEFPLVNGRSFVIAGAPTPQDFYHGFVGFEMGGGHLELSCEDCHPNAFAVELPEDEHRFLGLSQDCASCHEDPHDGPLDRACADCHGQEQFHELTPFAHHEEFPLEGAHDTSSCAECHAPGGPHAIEAVASFLGAEASWRACTDCHDNPHAPPFLAALAVGVEVDAACADCHGPTHAGFTDPVVAESLTDLQHLASGFALSAPHDDLACAACHDPGEAAFTARHPGRAASDCASCHDDPHGDQFGEQGCVSCHEDTHFLPHGFGFDAHANAGFQLDGAHAQTECNACHRQTHPDLPRAFAGIAARCEDCHGDAHQGAFDRFPEVTEHPEGDCASCHGTASFTKAKEPFTHGRWTGFELLGAHRSASCEACHDPLDAADEHGRTFGFATTPVQGCASCHSDPHDGFFDRPDVPSVEGAGCARCHVESSWRSFPAPFDHGAWTGFDLDDAHAAASCGDCHPPQPSDARSRSFQPARGTSCADCHTNPHGTQFAQGGETDCRSCHQSARSFGELTFDHGRDASFALDDAHRDLDCAACHKPWGEAGAVRYKPLGSNCVDCHGTESGRRRGRR